MTTDAIEELIAQRIADASLTYKANRNSGNVIGNGNDNGNGIHDSGSGSRRRLHTARGCTYKELLNCQPRNFKGTVEAVGLAQWFEKMESVFHISNCDVEGQVKYATCTLLNGALTWWNSTCPRNESSKAGIRVVNLTGLLDSVQGNVTSSKPMRLQEAIQIANSRWIKMVRAYAARQANNKIRMDNNPRDNDDINHPRYKRQNAARGLRLLVLVIKGSNAETHLCQGMYWWGYHFYKRIKEPPVENQRTLTCFECGNQGHYHSECPKLKNQNCENQTGNGKARGRVYSFGGGEADHDPNNIADDADA
ncbi:reverse transcriptase domain-containing protein [Tanacetum coccineum]